MNNSENFYSLTFSKPSLLADYFSNIITAQKLMHERQKLGQFFTPINTALKFVDFFNYKTNKTKIKICEPACGTAILSAAFIEKLCTFNKVSAIELTCYEIDDSILNYTNLVLQKLKDYCEHNGVSFNYSLINKDFILENKHIFDDDVNNGYYDVVISNPPFFKLNNYDNRVKIAQKIIFGLPNIYTIFYYISTKIVKNNGHLLFLIPRSFCSGSFFKQYRNQFVDYIKFNKIFHFAADNKIFDSHSVLYEFILLHSQKKKATTYNIKISHADKIDNITNITYNYRFNINTNLLPLAASKKDLAILKKIGKFNNTLKSLGFNVIYKQLIITEVENKLTSISDKNTIPVIWLHNIESKKFIFPMDYKYPNYIKNSKKIKQYTIPNKNYIFFRRYNNNDYITRIKSAVYLRYIKFYDELAIDRLVGVLYTENADITEETYIGISEYINSEFVNSYFRMINGIINVTGDMILDLPVPDISVLNKMGRQKSSQYSNNM